MIYTEQSIWPLPLTPIYPLHHVLQSQPPEASETTINWMNKINSERTIDIELKVINNSHDRDKLPKATSSI